MKRKISVVGLGYVGLPVAVAFGKKSKVIGFDINKTRIEELKKGHDRTHEVTSDDLKTTDIHYTTDAKELKNADFHIVTVPTPVDNAKQPDLTPVVKATESVGKNLSKGSVIVYESTVYPGVTEDICVPILEKESGLKCGVDFFVGYSPERINPGDKEHTFTKIKKVVSGQDEKTLDIVAHTYESVVTAGVHRASTIKVAESAKVIENIQRDVNIALMNELAILFSKLGIDTQDVLAASGTKWNFLPFSPGLVGGHCIGVDPYYLTTKASMIGYTTQMILSGRKVNDGMGEFVATQTIKGMIKQGMIIQGSTVTVLGLTFKEDVPDLRNSKVIDIINELKAYGVHVQVHDPYCIPEEAYHEYKVELLAENKLKSADAVVFAVAHKKFLDRGWEYIQGLLKNGKSVVMDVKSKLDKKVPDKDIDLIRL